MRGIYRAILAVAVIIASSMPACAEKVFLTVLTGGSAGTYYPIGRAISKTVSESKMIHATPKKGSGSVANLNQIDDGAVEIALAQNDITNWAVKGEFMFPHPLKNVRAIASLYPEHVQLVCARGSEIRGIEDIKGKKISVGAPGSGVECDVRALLSLFDMDYRSFKPSFLDFDKTVRRISDGRLDAGFIVAGYPTPSISLLASDVDIDIVDFSDEELAKITDAFPYFKRGEIPANTYSGVESSVNTPAVMALLVANANVPDDVVYEFTKMLFENVDAVRASHPSASSISIDSALDGLTAPLHPGAARYYEERGIEVR